MKTLDPKNGSYIAKVEWSFGTREIRYFPTAEQREEWVSEREEDIDYVVYSKKCRSTDRLLSMLGGLKGKYDPSVYNMSDFEMDVLL